MVKAVLNQPTRVNVVVEKEDGRLENQSPITLRNAVTETLTSIAQLQDVVEINKTENAAVVWNANTGRYEVKPLEGGDLDGGTF